MATLRLLTVRISMSQAIPFALAASPPQRLFDRGTSILSSVRASYATAVSPPSTAVVYDEQGPPDTVVKIKNLPPVEIKENDVCVRMLASPINPSDINRIEGLIFLPILLINLLFN